ncbi:MAG: metal-dependent hydrolase [Halodesulfurarchaeum sp.]
MFVGHAAIALAVAGGIALLRGLPRNRALAVACLAGLFATLPDVDMLFALSGFLRAESVGPFALAAGFWRASVPVHRSITHAIPVAIGVAVGASLMTGEGGRVSPSGLGLGRTRFSRRVLHRAPSRLHQTPSRIPRVPLVAGAGVLTATLLAIRVAGSRIDLLVGVVFVAGAVLLARGASQWGIDRKWILGSALLGLVSHPFGDLLTGRPPRLLFPLDLTVLDARVVLSTDPTMHLLGAFFVEVAAIWLGIGVLASLAMVDLREYLEPHALFGVGYGLLVAVFPPPTLETSYHFVFSVLAMGGLGIIPGRARLPHLPTAVVTGFAAVTLAGLAYTVGYLLVGGLVPVVP